jgi:hypothetical protein
MQQNFSFTLSQDRRCAESVAFFPKLGASRRIAVQAKLVLGSDDNNLAEKLRVTCTVETKFVTLSRLDPSRIG